MILDRLVLRDFGVYQGTQSFELTPQLPDKPVILFGGLNGGGKTTLLDAIRLVLFGRNAKCSTRKSLGYHEFLSRCIHASADKRAGAGIKLQFRYLSAGKTETLRVERSWYETKSGAVRENLRVIRDAAESDELDPTLTDAWAEHVHKFIPARISHLFFFDGEQIETLADVDNAADLLDTAITSLLGLDIVDQLIADLQLLERRKRSDLRRDEADAAAQAIRAVELDLARQVERHGELLAQKDRIQAQLDRATQTLHKAERAFKRRGGDAFEARTVVEAEYASVARHIEDLKGQLRTLAVGATPLLFVADGLFARIFAQNARESDAEQADNIAEVLRVRDSELLQQARRAGADHQLITRLSQFLSSDRETRAGEAEVDKYLYLNAHARSQLAALHGELLRSTRAHVDELCRKLEERRTALDSLETRLNAVPSSEAIAAVQRERDQARDAVAAQRARLHGISAETDRLQAAIERQQKDLQRLLHKQQQNRLATDDAQRLLSHSQQQRETMSTFRTHLIERHIRRIETLILESSRKLLRKKNLISGLSIDPETFVLTLRDGNGRRIDPGRLSAGERQLLAVSTLWGLARASGRPLPVVIDTPLGRLDSELRKHLVTRYFPHAAHQVLLLSTDEEIDERYYPQLAPYVARSYLLDNDDQSGSTDSRTGYFWECS